MRKVEIDLASILDLVVCSEDYGFNDGILMGALAEMVGAIHAQEIEEFTQRYLTTEAKTQGYSKEDADNVFECLCDWAAQYNIYEE